MDVQLFQIEHAVDYSDGGWVPGDFLYKRPIGGAENNGQYARNLFDVFLMGVMEGGHAPDWNTAADLWHEDPPLRKGRCQTCEVDWDNDPECWVCGKKCEYSPENALFIYKPFDWAPGAELDRWGYTLNPITAEEEDRRNGQPRPCLCGCQDNRRAGQNFSALPFSSNDDATSAQSFTRTLPRPRVDVFADFDGQVRIEIDANIVQTDPIVDWLQTTPFAGDLSMMWRRNRLIIAGITVEQQQFIMTRISEIVDGRAQAREAERYSFTLDLQNGNYGSVITWLETIDGVELDYDIDYNRMRIAGVPRSAYRELQDRVSRERNPFVF